MKEMINSLVESSIAVKKKILADTALMSRIENCVTIIGDAFRAGNKVLFCGNGGSAADAQHLAAEFSGRFYTDREALPAEALHTNTSYLTAVANDYGYDLVYSRLLQGIGKKGDVLIAISTSGNSANILKAIETAKSKGMTTIGFTGESGGRMRELCNQIINIPSSDTPRIQEAHIMVGHIICQLVESGLFPQESSSHNVTP